MESHRRRFARAVVLSVGAPGGGRRTGESMDRLLDGLGWLLLGIGVFVIASSAIALFGAHFITDAGALPDARGYAQGFSVAALLLVGIPFAVIGGLLISRNRQGGEP